MIADTIITTYIVKYAEVEVCEDLYDEGEGNYVNSWEIQELNGREYEDIRDLLDDIAEYSDIFTSDMDDYVYIDGRIDTDATVDVDNNIPNAAQIQMWRNGEEKLYVAHLCCGISVKETKYSYSNRRFRESTKHELTEDEAMGVGIPLA